MDSFGFLSPFPRLLLH